MYWVFIHCYFILPLNDIPAVLAVHESRAFGQARNESFKLTVIYGVKSQQAEPN